MMQIYPQTRLENSRGTKALEPANAEMQEQDLSRPEARNITSTDVSAKRPYKFIMMRKIVLPEAT